MLVQTATLLLSALSLHVMTVEGSHRAAVRSLEERQGSEAFIPDTNFRQGATCVDAFGPGYVACGPIQCINPAKGQICCSEGYGCPSGSFCLTKGYCCPNGLPPDTCASQHGITLPPGFKTDPVSPGSGPSTTPVGSATTPKPTTTTTYHTASVSATIPTSHGNFTASSTGVPQPTFTGAANLNSFAGGVAAVLAGFVGLMGNVL
ncbi:MAG: hypothetical protein M1839_003617 [Geoglossum umbratile]|nr:MAG: hypothetical protein M1839_003617 [Geoglossum umbratile]